MVKVKICGITNFEDAFFSSEAGADALGFIFTKKSPRYIKPESARKIISKLGPFAVKVGVFLDEEKADIRDIASYTGLDVLQFHGGQSPAFYNVFRDRFKVIKVVFPRQDSFITKLSGYKADAVMFDVKYEDKQRGIKTLSAGSLSVIKTFIQDNQRVIISGGLNPDNILPVLKLKPYAVDVAGGVEKFVGRKDKELVRLFIKTVKGRQ